MSDDKPIETDGENSVLGRITLGSKRSNFEREYLGSWPPPKKDDRDQRVVHETRMKRRLDMASLPPELRDAWRKLLATSSEVTAVWKDGEYRGEEAVGTMVRLVGHLQSKLDELREACFQRTLLEQKIITLKDPEKKP